MGIIKNEHGVYLVRRKVPKNLEEAVAQILGSDKAKVVWLQRSLRTKDLKRTNTLAKPVMVEFDRIIAKAEAELRPHAIITTLSARSEQHGCLPLLADDG